MIQWYVIDRQGQQIGPIFRDQVVQMIASGALQPQSMVWTEAYGGAWKPLTETEFVSLLSARRSPPPPPNRPQNNTAPWSGSKAQPQSPGLQNYGQANNAGGAQFAHANSYHHNQSFTEKYIVIVVYALYIAGIFSFALTTIIGLVIAYVKRPTSSVVAQSHFTFQIFTFWLNIAYAIFISLSFLISIAVVFIMPALSFFMFGIIYISIFGVFLWYVVRVIKGIVFANDNRAISLPSSWWLG